MVTGSGFGGSSVPQNLGVGQKNAQTATSWGWGGVCGTVEKTICKLSYQFRMSLRNNDDDKKSSLGVRLNAEVAGIGWCATFISQSSLAPIPLEQRSPTESTSS
jgi:hypothetical protein